MFYLFNLKFGKEQRSINDPLNYQAQNPEHPSSNPSRWLLDIFNSKPTSAGVRVDPDTAPAFSAVYRCVSLISSTLAILPLNVYKHDGTGRQIDRGHQANTLFRKPSEIYTSYFWRETMMQFALLWGNGYSEILRDKKYNITGFKIHHSKDIKPYILQTKGGYDARFYEVVERDPQTGQSYRRLIESANMIHIPCLSFDGIAGKSPVEIARENIGLGLAAEKFAGDFYKNDAAYSGIYTHPGELNDEAYKRLKESLASHSMYGEKNKTLLLEGGTDYKPVTMPMRDAQFIESRKFQIEEIARMYGVPLHKLANLDRSTNNNIETQALEFVSDTMLSWCVKWEEELDSKIFTTQEQGTYFCKFNLAEMTRGDSVARANYFRTMFGIGSMCQDEIREAEDLPPLPDNVGKRFFIPLNMVDAEKAEMDEPTDGEEGNPTGQKDIIEDGDK